MNLRFAQIFPLAWFLGLRHLSCHGGIKCAMVHLRKKALTFTRSITCDPMMHTYFSPEDLHQIITRGQTLETVLSQIEIFERGIPYTKLHRPCTVDDGITVLQQSDIEVLGTLYAEAVSAGRVTKFVPASGAATRMFQALISCCEHKEDADSNKDVSQFANNIKRFAFYDDLQAAVHRHGGEVE